MPKKPVAIIILDGFGWRDETYGNAVRQAHKPNFDRYWKKFPHATMQASGLAVGLPDGQMGNSEVGHTNIGAGRIVYQSLTRIDKAIQEGTFFDNHAFKAAYDHTKKQNSSLHIMGLLSDGGVHSSIKHIEALIKDAKDKGVRSLYLHAFMDGRDVDPHAGISYIEEIEKAMEKIGLGEIATVSGRYYAMDRDNRWERIKLAYDALVHGEGRKRSTATEAIKDSYTEDITDEFIIPTVIEKANSEPKAMIKDHDAVIFANFRPDRAIQLSKALSNPSFNEFEMGNRPRELCFVTMTEYNADVLAQVAYPPIALKNVVGEVLSREGLRQIRIAETEKYPHVTFFMNGGSHQEFPGEKRILIPSPKVATYDLKPEMSAYEVRDALLEEIGLDSSEAIILNFANPDMVGHSGKLEPTIRAIEAVDECLGDIVDAILEKGGAAIIFADHGNSETMIKEDGSPHTAHTTVPVPLIVTVPGVTLRKDGCLADVAPTMLDLLGLSQPEEMSGKSLIQ